MINIKNNNPFQNVNLRKKHQNRRDHAALNKIISITRMINIKNNTFQNRQERVMFNKVISTMKMINIKNNNPFQNVNP